MLLLHASAVNMTELICVLNLDGTLSARLTAASGLTPELPGVCCWRFRLPKLLLLKIHAPRELGWHMATAKGTIPRIVRFDCYEADLTTGELRRRGVPLRVREQSFQVLGSLLENPGQVVTREELRRRIWGDEVFVDFENNLNSVVANLRDVLGDSAEHPRFIETLPKRGYRFIADVCAVSIAATQPQPSRPRLLVLPFVNLSGDTAQDYFSDAMTDEIIAALASVAPEQLAVIARTTAMRYKGSRKDVGRIGRELNVDYVLEGAVRRYAERVDINVQLIQTRDQAHLFAQRYDEGMRDLFRLHGRIGVAVATHIPGVAEKVRLATDSAPAASQTPTADLAAYNEYIKGRYEMFKWTPESIAKAKQHFEAALARDPQYALAYCGLAELHWYLGLWGFAPSDETEAIWRVYVRRALELDPTLAETHALLGPPKRDFQERFYQWKEVEQQIEHARTLNPNSPVVMLRYAAGQMVFGDMSKCIAELDRALEIDPLSAEVRIWLTGALCLGRDYKRALEEVRKLVELEPRLAFGYMMLGWVYLGMKDFEESICALRKAVELSGGFPQMLGWLGLALGLGGHTVEARSVLEQLRAIAAHRYVQPTSFAWTQLGLGEIDEAFTWMERAADRHDRMVLHIRTYPFMDTLRDDPRLKLLLRKLNLLD